VRKSIAKARKSRSTPKIATFAKVASNLVPRNYEIEMISPRKLGRACAWEGCTAKIDPDCELPPGWANVVAYYGPKTFQNFSDIPVQAQLRDCTLCPEHAGAFDRMLKPIPRHGEGALQ
jgi:hypothetical protein